jgi:site-specific DNA-cytosine methylase
MHVQSAKGTSAVNEFFRWLRDMAASAVGLPECLLLETPVGFLSVKEGGSGESTMWGLYRDLRESGYGYIAHRTVHCACFGDPTNRERVIIMAGVYCDMRPIVLSEVSSIASSTDVLPLGMHVWLFTYVEEHRISRFTTSRRVWRSAVEISNRSSHAFSTSRQATRIQEYLPLMNPEPHSLKRQLPPTCFPPRPQLTAVDLWFFPTQKTVQRGQIQSMLSKACTYALSTLYSGFSGMHDLC